MIGERSRQMPGFTPCWRFGSKSFLLPSIRAQARSSALALLYKAGISTEADPTWRVTSMTSGDFNGDGRDELVSALHTPSMSQSRLSRGNGTTSVTNFGDLYTSSTYNINAVAGG